MDAITGKTVDFGTIAQIILGNAVRGYQDRDFMALLCDSIPVEQDFQWDAGNFSRMVHGKRQVFPKVSAYYQTREGLEELTTAVEELLLGEIADVPHLLRELEAVVRCDGTISMAKRERLLSGTDAEVIAKVLQFAIIRPEGTVTGLSPRVETLFRRAAMPKPEKTFVGREAELVEIENSLKMDNIFFITGAPGIGKRSLARQFAHRNRKRYTNRLYIRYHDSIRDTIADLWHIEDSLREDSEERFQRHLRLLSCLNEDSLLVIVGMDCLPEKDGSFELLYQLDCHVIVTTELEMQQENRLILGRFDDPEEALQLFEAYCPKSKVRGATQEEVLRLLDLIGRHTYGVQLLALTVKNGFVTVPELTARIEAEGLTALEEMPVEVKRDGRYQYDSCKEILASILQIQNFGEREQSLLSNFSLMPLTGVQKARFGKWTGHRMAIQLLIRLGWIRDDDNTLSMSALVRDMISETLCPDAENCKHLMEQMVADSKRCKGENALELVRCMGSVCRRIWNADKGFISFLVPFGTYISQNCSDSTQRLMRLIPEQERDTPSGRVLFVYLKVIRLLGEEMGRLSRKGQQLSLPDYRGEDQQLADEMKQLADEVDEKAAAWLQIACYTLANLVMMGKNIGLLIALIQLKNEINERYGLPVPHDNDLDIVVLWGVLDMLYESPQRANEFRELLGRKRKESIEIGDSEVYRSRLDSMEEVCMGLDSFKDEAEYQEAMFKLTKLVPGIAGQLRRMK